MFLRAFRAAFLLGMSVTLGGSEAAGMSEKRIYWIGCEPIRSRDLG